MKKTLTILLLFFTIFSYGQTKLDMVAFNALNEYRIEHGVEPLIFDSTLWVVTEHHSDYLCENGYPSTYVCSSGHNELVLVEFTDRLRYYDVKWSGTGGECVAAADVAHVGEAKEIVVPGFRLQPAVDVIRARRPGAGRSRRGDG